MERVETQWMDTIQKDNSNPKCSVVRLANFKK